MFFETAFFESILGPYFGECAMQRTEQEVMHKPAVAKAYFVFGGVHVHVDERCAQFQVQNKRRMTAVE